MNSAAGARRLVTILSLAAMAFSELAAPPVSAQGPRRPPPGFRPPPPRPPVVVNNYSNNGSGLAAGALGFGFGMLAGAASTPRQAPGNTVVVTPPASSVVVAHSNPAVVVSQPAPPVVVTRPIPADSVAEGLKMLNGRSWKTRRDGAMILGRTRSQAAVGPLMDKLRNDRSEEVRKASAWALAEIGDTAAIDYLEKTAQFDHSPEVRAAARTAQQRLLNRIAMATPPVTRTERISIEPARTIESPPLPPPAPAPAASSPTSGEKVRSSLPRGISPGTSTQGSSGGRVPSAATQPPSTKSPFFDPPATAPTPEPALELSPPARPLDIP